MDRINASVRGILGPEYNVRDVSIHGGSVELWLIVTTAFAVITNWGSFRQGLDYLISDLRKVILMIAPAKVKVTDASWSPGPALLQPQLQVPPDMIFETRLMVTYLVLSHAALLALVLWMVWLRLRT